MLTVIAMTTAAAPTAESTPHELSREEGLAVLDRQARRYLGMSGEDFVQAWRSGTFDQASDRPKVMRVAMLLPLAG